MSLDDVPADVPINRVVDWPSFFVEIRLRPGMWFGRTWLSALEAFLAGIAIAEELYNVPEEKRLGGFSFEEFEAWAAEHFNPEDLSFNSFSLARRSTDTEEAAFARWFDWYDRFRRERGEA